MIGEKRKIVEVVVDSATGAAQWMTEQEAKEYFQAEHEKVLARRPWFVDGLTSEEWQAFTVEQRLEVERDFRLEKEQSESF